MTAPPASEAIHVYPERDIVPHVFDGECPCGPRIECGGLLLIHNSWDEREKRKEYEAHVEALHEQCRGVAN